MSLKLPTLKEAGRAYYDPLDMGLGDAMLGQDDIAPGNEAEKAAQDLAFQDYMNSIKDFEENGYQDHTWGGDVVYEQLGELPQLGRSAMNDINVDPRYHDYELDALRSLEDSAQNGMTATDRAEMARLNSDVNRQNAGRVGAIGQNMQARGLGGSGLEMVSQMQGAQASADREALAAMEKAGQIQQGKRQASMQLGQLGSQMKGAEFNQQAQVANANDAISRFNTQNSVNRATANNGMLNQATQQNWQGKQDVANRNTEGGNQHRAAVLGAKQDGSKLGYDKATDAANSNTAKWEGEQDKEGKQKGALMQAGVAVASMFSDETVKKNVKKESDGDIEDFLKNLNPKSYEYKDPSHGQTKHGIIAQDLSKSKIGSDMLTDKEGKLGVDVNSAVSALLQAVAYLNKQKGK